MAVQVHVTESPKRPFLLLRWHDPRTGESGQVSSKIPVGKGEREKNRNRAKAGQMAAELALEIERRPVAPEEPDAKTDIETLIDRWEVHVRNREPDESHVADWRAMVERVAKESEIVDVAELTAHRVSLWLQSAKKTKLGKGGSRVPTDERLAAATSNHYLKAMKAFANFLVHEGVLPRNPLEHIPPRNVEVDRRRVRRAFSDDEFRRLIEAAEHGPSVEGVSGPDRVALYALGTWTGLRRKELSRLTPRSFDLSADPPLLHVKAKDAKGKTLDSLPLHVGLIERLAEWLGEKLRLPPSSPVLPLRYPGGRLRKTSVMVRSDLSAARDAWLEESETPEERHRRESSDFLMYKSSDDTWLDFHSQRHSFISSLVASGVALAEVQKLARHKDPKITAQVYLHIQQQQLASAVGKLPGPPPKKARRVRLATAT